MKTTTQQQPSPTQQQRRSTTTTDPIAAAASSTTTSAEMNRSSSSSRSSNAALGGFLPILNIVAYIVNVAVTYGIGVAGIFNLPTNSVLSEKYQTIVTPIGWAFAIWGIIFISQGIWSLMQLLSYTGRFPRRYSDAIATVKWNYLLVVLSQVGWTLTFANEWIIASAIMMVSILWNLGVVVFALSPQRRTAEVDDVTLDNSSTYVSTVLKYVLTEFPFTIHFGWILAATVVNINVVLVSEAVSSDIQYYSAVSGLVLLFIVALWLTIKRGFATIPLVAAWALFGIYSELKAPKETIVATFTEMQLQTIQYGALGAMTMLLVIVLLWTLRRLYTMVTASNRSTDESVYLRANEM